jgi:hypothetical protein
MTVDPLCIRWPGLAPEAPRVPTTLELLARDDATAIVIRAYLDVARALPERGDLRL